MMDANKRNFLTAMIPMVLGAPLGLFSSAGVAYAQNGLPARPEPAQSPGAPKLDQPMPSDGVKPNSKEAKDILKQNQRQIAENVKRIYKLAEELKDEVEKTDATNTLSLPMVQKAEQIEKLAKQVKNLARGG
jgi:hypothetical protein